MTPLQFELFVFITDKIITLAKTLKRVSEMDDEKLKVAIPIIRQNINGIIDVIKNLGKEVANDN
jgi:hypothetical protein